MRMMKRFTGRITAIVMVILVLATLLVSCSGGDEVKLEVGSIHTTESNALNSYELEKVGEMLQSAYSQDYNVQEKLVAANRGYDLTKEDGNDKDKEYVDLGANVEAAKNVLREANDKAKEDKIGNDLIDKFNEHDLKSIVNALELKIDVDTEGGIMIAIGKVLGWITRYLGFGSYFVGICIFAIIIEILMLPFGIKQQKNSIRQAELRPKEMAIRNKYKGRNDQVTMQKMQQEIQEFYQRENFSPFSGCLPLLIQLPIIIALYNIIIDPLHYVLGQSTEMTNALTTFLTTSKAAGGLGHSSVSGTIEMLSALKDYSMSGLKSFQFFSNGEAVYDAYKGIANNIPNFNIGSVNFGLTPGIGEGRWVLLFVPVLTFVAYFGTSKLNRKFTVQPVANEGADARQVACSNKMMDFTMPAMSTFFTFMVPALIGVYWVFRSLVGLLKQFILSRVMPLPKFTEEDYKAAAKEMAGKNRQNTNVQKSANVGKVRSLHYIDDEDFEDTRERGLARRAAMETQETEKTEKKPSGDTPFGDAPVMKEDKKHEDQNDSQE